MRIAAAGDVFCHTRFGLDPFRYVADVFRGADMSIVNLETVLTDREPSARKHVQLTSPPSSAKFLAPFQFVHIENNHIYDCGLAGYHDTVRALSNMGIHPIGDEFNWMTHWCRGIKVGILGFLLYPDERHEEEKALDRVRAARSFCDVLIVSLHWGSEHVSSPSPDQVKFAHALIESGAALILGHHSHRVQLFEQYQSGLIAYSMGNFNFWQFDRPTRWYNRCSVILLVELERDGVRRYDLVPVWILCDYSPYLLRGAMRERALRHLVNLPRPGSWEEWYEEEGEANFLAVLRGLVTLRHFDRLWWWLGQRHTQRAFVGLVRSWWRRLYERMFG